MPVNMMTREIEFRAWDKIGEYWHEDDTIIDFKNRSVVYRSDGAEGVDDGVSIVQYIGLKDRNKVKIYSDDLLNIHINRVDRGAEYDYLARVVWNDKDLCWSIQSKRHGEEHIAWVLDGFDGKYIERVGSALENPELLEKVV